ncbi:MAG: HAMP domain-containing sensor histidine kinase [Verrucomicrobiota bacterium]
MSARESSAGAVLEALGIALFIRDVSGTLQLSGLPPPWLEALWPEAARADAPLDASALSPFLDNFLIDAEECWARGEDCRVRSGPWIEPGYDGAAVQLEATALKARGEATLLIERLGEEFETRKSILQKARETVIAYQRLNSEMQKKEILLHCIAEDMSGALGNVITSLRLIELEEKPDKIRRLLELAMLATQEQQSLIHRVLDVFSEELQSLYGREGTSRADTDLHAVLQGTLDAARPAYLEKGVALAAPLSPGEGRVAMEAGHLERTLANLLENALLSTPAGGTVSARIEEERESLVAQIDDDGPIIPEEVREKLFAKFDPTDSRPQSSTLRLHFCRIAIENCGGEIGHSLKEEGGNRFWIRLPKSHPAR